MVYVGCPIANLIRWNAERGECGPGEVDAHVARRLNHMTHGHLHVYERVRADGRVIEMRGQPMPAGGFTATFTDITEYKRNEQALRDAKAHLEHRVDERTRALSQALKAQREAKRDAEQANESKSRFLAAASHDLVQPLNAARLFVSALASQPIEPVEAAGLVERIHSSLRNAGDLLDGLLDLSRLDSGALRPELVAFSAGTLCEALYTPFAAVAAERGLTLRWHSPDINLRCDRVLLRRILQNLMSNALRYTRHGGVLLAVRRRGGLARIQVWDTGPGIPEEQILRVFEEFRRLDPPSPWGEQGLGLGLSICQRIAHLLDVPLRLHSRPGRGSLFEVDAPIARADEPLQHEAHAHSSAVHGALHVLCVDDDLRNLEGMQALLGRWGVQVDTAPDLEQALRCVAAQAPDLLLIDYRLGGELDGFAVAEILARESGNAPARALVTAENAPALIQRARVCGMPVLSKPIRPAALRALVEAAVANRRGATETSVPQNDMFNPW